MNRKLCSNETTKQQDKEIETMSRNLCNNETTKQQDKEIETMSRKKFFTGYKMMILITFSAFFILLASSDFLKEKATEIYNSEDMQFVRSWVESFDEIYGE